MTSHRKRSQRRDRRSAQQRNERIAGISAAVIIIVILYLLFTGLGGGTDEFDFDSFPQIDSNQVQTSPSGLRYQDLILGTGEIAQPGDEVTVHYTGWLENNIQFDSSHDRDEPFSFTLGVGSVIQGWDEGVAGMLVGGKRLLIIPADLGYGETGSGGTIPPGATLIFEVELLGVSK